MGLHVQQLAEYLGLHVNQRILNKMETYTPSGRSVMTSVAIPSLHTVFSLFHRLQLIFWTLLNHSLMTKSAPLDKLNNGRREPEKLQSES